jgi:hypothetical protein
MVLTPPGTRGNQRSTNGFHNLPIGSFGQMLRSPVTEAVRPNESAGHVARPAPFAAR